MSAAGRVALLAAVSTALAEGRHVTLERVGRFAHVDDAARASRDARDCERRQQ